MKRYVIDGGFGLDHLKAEQAEVPKPGPGQVLMKVAAVSLNYRDLMMVQGAYNPKQPLPLVPCSDGAGEVLEVGRGVTRVKPGDRVCTTFFDNWVDGEPTLEAVRATRGGPIDGTLAEYILVNEPGLVHAPEHLTFEEASTLTCAGVTAWTALHTAGNLKPGEVVLTLGTGGVSTFALQLAKVSGARVIVTSSSDEKLERAKAMGADGLINYKSTPKWGKEAKELSGGRGVDLVMELGGAGTLNESIKALTVGGRISLIGVLSGAVTDLNVVHIFRAVGRVQGIFVGHRASFEALNRALAAHEIKPLIDRTFDFDQAAEAFSHLKSQRHQGKVVIRI